MRLQHALSAAALFAFLAAAPALALPPTDFCERNPDSPLCQIDDPPIDPCEINPDLCEPPDPCELDPASCEPDPCELDPASCEPDPCEVDPASCEPDPCELDPASCEPEPEPEPEPTGESAELTGSARVKGEGFKETVPLAFDLFLDGTTFVLSRDSGCSIYQGQLAPKGKKGQKFQLFLDEPSSDAFTALVAIHAGQARGTALGAPLGESTRLVLKRGDDGSASLKLKSEVLFEEGEVLFKGKLSGVLTDGRAVQRDVPRCP
jgi:hypothetical protein